LKALKQAGIRAVVDLSNEKIGYKIREYTLQKMPYLLVVGDKEKAEGRVALRSRAGEDFGSLPLADVIARLSDESRMPGGESAC
jgi:threonyl-tRNA synthetase